MDQAEPTKFHHASYNFLSTKIPESLRHSISRKPIIHFPAHSYRSHSKQPTQYTVGFVQALNAIVALGLTSVLTESPSGDRLSAKLNELVFGSIVTIKMYSELTPDSYFTLDRNLSPMGLNDRLYNRQSQPHSSSLPRPVLFDSVKTIEQVR